MASTDERAQLALIKLGTTEIEGLLLPDGRFAISVSQVCSVFQFVKYNYQRDIKALLGNTFQFVKTRSILNPKAVNVLLLPDFEKLIFELVIQQQNKVAIELLRTLAGLSLYQLFSDAFHIKFEKDERQAWLKARAKGKQTRRTLTDAIKSYCETYNKSGQYCQHIYSNVSDQVNKAVFGRGALDIRSDWNLSKTACLREFLTDKELSFVNSVEDLTMRLIDQDQMEPMVAVKEATKRLIIKPCDR